jgi:outer membrane protein OmpA-like peptidoglycan-associated protein
LVGLSIGLLWGSGAARGQGFQLNRYEPTPAGEWFFSVEHPWYSSTRWFAGGLTLDYGHEPLVAGTRDASGDFHQTAAVVEHQLALHVDVAASFLDRVLVGVSLPIVLFESGTAVPGFAPLSGAAVGDPRIDLDVRLWGQHERSPIGISVGGHLWIPVGVEGNHAGDSNVRGVLKAILGGKVGLPVGALRWTFNAGVLIRESAQIGPALTTTGGSVGTELQLGAGVAWAGLDDRLHIGPELALASVLVNGHAFKEDSTSLDVLVGVNYLIADLILVGAAGGIGALREVGTPDGRFIFRAAYAPRRKAAPKAAPPPAPADRDMDGVPDAEDACPDRAGPPNANALENGCPAKPAPAPTPPPAPAPPPDQDKDGVPDAKDNCPDQPAGEHPDSRQPGCPAPDSDLDNVFDDVDACPNTPGVPNADPAKNGCPLPDRDNDGIPDDFDACPDRPGVADPDAKRNGCPRVQVRSGQTTVLQPVFFATNEDTILPQSFPMLQAVAASLASQPQIKRVSIDGHADDRGSAMHNLDLSVRRAASIMKFLIEHGVSPDRLESHGYGATKPVTERRDEKSRATNRRVEFRIIRQEP